MNAHLLKDLLFLWGCIYWLTWWWKSTYNGNVQFGHTISLIPLWLQNSCRNLLRFPSFLSWCRFQPWCSEYFLLNLLHPLEPFRKILVFHFVWTHNASKVQNCKIILICFFQTWLHLSSCVFSIALFFIVALIYNISCPICYPPSNPYWTMEKLMGEPVFYLTCLISPVVALLPR